MIEMTYNLL